MSARYGSRTRTGDAVSNFGQRGGAGGGLSEVTMTASPSPAVSTSPVIVGTEEFYISQITASTTLTFAGAPANATGEILIVAGGGGGGNGSQLPYGVPDWHGGGGGAGGVFSKYVQIASTSYPIVIGGGGSAQTNGTPTTGFSVTATGGGAGGGNGSPNGQPGGSGGGGAAKREPPTSNGTAGNGTTGQGTAGLPAVNLVSGGGGGATRVGFSTATSPFSNGRQQSGGIGTINFFPNASPYSAVAGGGGGIGDNGQGGAPGGTGGGASGGGGSGTANTGGGGGGGRTTGGSGGSGLIVLRWKRFQG